VSQSIADRSRFRLVVLFASACTLAACGGGGGGGDTGSPSPSPTPAPPATPLTLATCMQDPTGVTNTYLNSSRPRREWKAATFLGESVVARNEYADATTATPTRAFYYKYDAAAQTVTTAGHEDFNAAGAVTTREQYTGLVNSTALAAGQSEAKTYTVKTLVPSGTADRTERVTVTYEANDTITLPEGRLDACRVKSVLESIAAGGAATQVSTETLYLAPGLGFVKSYYKPLLAGFVDRNQTYLTELVATTGTLALQATTADKISSLAACSALAAGITVELTASNAGEANSAVRMSRLATFNGVQALAMERRNAATGVKSQISYMDPAVAQLMFVGEESYASDGTTLVLRRTRTGRPDLRTASFGTPVTYTETYTTTFPTPAPAPTTSNDSFLFDGYAKVTTPAGTYDTCRVRFTYQSGLVETYYHAPGLHWVRLDSTQAGIRTTRELIAHTP